jgi:beta-carotene hydroxylase
MLLRHSADRRTLLWMLVFAPGLVLAQYLRPEWQSYLAPFSFYFSMSSAMIAHNHQHSPTFKHKALNRWFGSWVSIFYGYPAMPAWIPTHNLNHHKLVNKPGDASITWRLTNSHNAFVAATYFGVSAYYQADLIKGFVSRARARQPALFRQIVLQYVFVYGVHAAMLAVAVAAYGPSLGVSLWALCMGLPALFALWAIQLFSYETHVHTDPWSRWNHSRNFESKLLNYLVFNNGLHTAHHEQPGLNWSKLPELHASVRPHVDPRLNIPSVTWYWLKQYLLSPFWPRLGTAQIGRAPFDVPSTVDARLGSSLGSSCSEHPSPAARLLQNAE